MTEQTPTLPILCVTLEEAARLIGGNKPISRTTLQRMVNAGVLEARGQGRLRRITMSSIMAYITGETVWHGARVETEASIKTKLGNGGRKSRSGEAAPVGRVVLIARRPRRRSAD